MHKLYTYHLIQAYFTAPYVTPLNQNGDDG